MLKPYVLIIDDDTEYLALLKEGLEDRFNILCANNLASAEDLLKEHIMFDIALVDENIGDEKGSQWIKKQQANNAAAKSFVLYSGLATEEAILKGLACGADDFLAKPISLLALNNKLEKLIDYQNKIHNFEDQLKSKDSAINVSLAQATKYGSCLQLIANLNQCGTVEEIRDQVFAYFHAMDLHGCIAFYPMNQKPLFFNAQKGYCSPVEVEVMELLKIKSRLYHFGPRTIFNHALASILILNLAEGALETEVYIDALASIISCVGSRIEFINYKQSLVNIQQQIQQAITTTKKMVEISKVHQQGIMNEIVQSIGLSFHVLDLTMEQEDHLMNLVHSALKKNSQDDVNFLEISHLLDNALQSVDKLKVLNMNKVNSEEDDLF